MQAVINHLEVLYAPFARKPTFSPRSCLQLADNNTPIEKVNVKQQFDEIRSGNRQIAADTAKLSLLSRGTSVRPVYALYTADYLISLCTIACSDRFVAG